MIVFTSFLLSSSYIKKKKMMKGEEKRFIHSFKADVKIPETSAITLATPWGRLSDPQFS